MFDKLFNRYKKLFFYSIVAILVGITVGVAMGLFGRVLYAINGFRDSNIRYILPFLPIAGLLIVYAFKKYGVESSKGLSLIFKTSLDDKDHIPKALIPLIVFATLVSTFFGASTGREGAAVQIGSTMSYSISKRFKIVPDKSMFIIIGIAAGFGGLFRTPLGATVFALEVLITGIVMYEALFPSLLAALTASNISGMFGLSRMSFEIPSEFLMDLDATLLFKLIALGLIFGLVGAFFSYAVHILKDFMTDHFPDPRRRIFLVGIFLTIVLYAFHFGRYSAAGDGLLYAVYNGGVVYNYDWIMKLLLTALSLAIGFHGGEVVPLFAVGSTLGFVIAPMFGLPNEYVAALGLIAVFSSATGTVLSPIILASEIFNNEYAMHFALISFISYAFHSSKTIYLGQERYTFFTSKKLLKDALTAEKFINESAIFNQDDEKKL